MNWIDRLIWNYLIKNEKLLAEEREEVVEGLI